MTQTSLRAAEHIEPRQTKVTARLNAQGAMLEELLIMTSAIGSDYTREAAKKAVLEDNVLHRPSLGSRVDVFEKLSVRYLRPDAPRAVSRSLHAVQTASDRLQAGLFAYIMLLPKLGQEVEEKQGLGLEIRVIPRTLTSSYPPPMKMLSSRCRANHLETSIYPPIRPLKD